jgi:small subunit ribosomal protein S16
MLVIRLQRRGRKGLAMYRIVVQDKRTHPTKEKVIARLGSYNPHTKELVVEKELAEKFLTNGAQPSERTASLLKQAGVKLPKWVAEALKKEGKLRNAEKLRKNQPKEEPQEQEIAEDSEESQPKEKESEASPDQSAEETPIEA